jgi:hypothetical protein
MVAAMTTPQVEIDSETSRIRAAIVNSGHYSFSEADEKLAASKLSLFLSSEAACTPAGQAAFLTATVTAARCFGAVSVHGDLDQPLLLPLPLQAGSLADAALELGARGGEPFPNRAVLIGPALNHASNWSVQAYWDGWVAGVAPGPTRTTLGRGDCVLAGVAAGALAVGQAFMAEQGNPRAGRTTQYLSLWSPEMGENSLHTPGPAQAECHLPLHLWLVGLGNLGQAFLWSLSMLPYPDPDQVLLFLQDDDFVRKENWGTSILVHRGRYGILKTRMAEEWAETRKFHVRRIDRRLDQHLRRTDQEPLLALAGLDRMPPRRLLGLPGFDYVIDAGLGATATDYQKVRLNVFDSTIDPARHFEGVEDETEHRVAQLMQLPAYQKIAHEIGRNGGDAQCGAAMLAEYNVAVPFVSAFAGALAVTQAIRIGSGKAHHSALTGDSGDLRSIRATPAKPPERPSIASALAAA